MGSGPGIRYCVFCGAKYNDYFSGMEFGVLQVVSMQGRSTPGARQGCHGTTVGWRGSLPGVRTA